MDTVEDLISNLKKTAGLTNERLAAIMSVKQPNFNRIIKNDYPKDRAHLKLLTFIQDITGLKGKAFEIYIRSIHTDPYHDSDQELKLPRTNNDRNVRLYIREIKAIVEKMEKYL